MEHLKLLLDSFDNDLEVIKKRKETLVATLKESPNPLVENLIYKELRGLHQGVKSLFSENSVGPMPYLEGYIPPSRWAIYPDLKPLSIGLIRDHQKKTFKITTSIINNGTTLQAPFKIFVAVEIRFLDNGIFNTLYIENTHVVSGTVRIPGYGAGIYSTTLKGEYPMHYIEDHAGNKFDIYLFIDNDRTLVGGNIIEGNENNNNYVVKNHFHTKNSFQNNQVDQPILLTVNS